MPETIICPACCAHIAYWPDLSGLAIYCRHCRHPFVIQPPCRHRREAIRIPRFNLSNAPPPLVPALHREPDGDDHLPHLLPDDDDLNVGVFKRVAEFF
ncbi:MAG TPA: hypothetical protein VF669_10410 [Tepidisphaeraceae bacterium]|jgi:hypothetical protein